jgi:2-isopropylmalate synthase
MESCFGFKMPKGMHKEFAGRIQKIAEGQGEVAPEQIFEEFKKEYLEKKEPLHFRRLSVEEKHGAEDSTDTEITLCYTENGAEKVVKATGNGPIDAVLGGLRRQMGHTYKVLDYTEHSLGLGESAQAAAYIHMLDTETGETTYGVGISSNITRASIRAIFSAMNRLNGR